MLEATLYSTAFSKRHFKLIGQEVERIYCDN